MILKLCMCVAGGKGGGNVALCRILTLRACVLADPAESDGRLQSESRDVGRAPCTYLKFTIASGWFDFVTIHNIAVEGSRS